MRSRAVRFASIWLGLLSFFFLWAPASSALSEVSETGSFVRTLCEGDCGALGAVPEGPGGTLSEIDFDFSLGLQAVGDGLSIDLIAGGNIYVAGPLSATGDVHITALGDLHLISSAIIDSELRARIDAGIEGIETDHIITLTDPGLNLNLGTGTGPGIRIGNDGSITLVARSVPLAGDLTASLVAAATGADLSLRAGTAAGPGTAASSGGDPSLFDFTFIAPGNVYLDVSQAVLGSLRLSTEKVLVIGDASLTPPVVPEPATGLLLGLGLLGLGLRARGAHLFH